MAVLEMAELYVYGTGTPRVRTSPDYMMLEKSNDPLSDYDGRSPYIPRSYGAMFKGISETMWWPAGIN